MCVGPSAGWQALSLRMVTRAVDRNPEPHCQQSVDRIVAVSSTIKRAVQRLLQTRQRSEDQPMQTQDYEACLQACTDCAVACERCASACLGEENVRSMARCIELDRDCADTCRLAALLMARNSSLAKDACRLCAWICRACGEECGKHEHEHCRQCAAACRLCAEACERMAA